MSPQHSHAYPPPCGRGRAALRAHVVFQDSAAMHVGAFSSFPPAEIISPRHTLEVSSTMNTLIMNILMCSLDSQPRSAQQRQAAGAFSLSPPLRAALPGTWEGGLPKVTGAKACTNHGLFTRRACQLDTHHPLFSVCLVDPYFYSRWA